MKGAGRETVIKFRELSISFVVNYTKFFFVNKIIVFRIDPIFVRTQSESLTTLCVKPFKCLIELTLVSTNLSSMCKDKS
ncbi:hypothetical protein BpHYR1_050395 [Brachionus plicatilis]|uniref:Uncharacterized protein n=1 Tax=Brachionus plicatilis TaxID=10195 RepID=A0A3M7SC74_BRAPC|nr:hypothetical protein BpHYR1_050395 [Brachionus plicatilis]